MSLFREQLAMAGRVMWNFYNSALSLFNTYKDRVVADGGVLGDNTNFGPELVTNGGGSSIEGWVTGNASILSLDASYLKITNGSNNYGYFYQAFNTKVGKKYKVSFDFLYGDTSAVYRISLNSSLSHLIVNNTLLSSSSTSMIFTSTSTVLYIGFVISTTTLGLSASFKNISVRELLEVNTTSYIKMCKLNNMYDSIKLGWLGVGGSIANTSNNIKKLYSITSQGTEVLDTVEKVVNGGFDTDTVWSKGAGITISGGTANFLNVASGINITQSTILTVGKQYKLVFEISNYVLGAILLNSSTGVGTQRKTNGIFSEVFVATSITLWLMAVGTTTLSIDNVSIKEVLSGDPLDLSSVGGSSYPFYLGTIAPNENPYIKNPSGSQNYLIHPIISFSATDAWSMTTLVNVTTSREPTSNFYASDNSSSGSLFGFDNLSGTLKIRNTLSQVTATLKKVDFLIGKNTIITIVAKGDNTLDIYINGTLFETLPIVITSINFSCLMTAITNQTPFKGSIAAHIIRSQALTSTQVLAESNFIKNLYPEIPNVTIGTQQWQSSNCEMTCTPRGNLINNVQPNVSVEKVVNGGFDTNLNNWILNGGIATWNTSGFIDIDSATNGIYIYQGMVIKINTWYKYSYEIKNIISGNVQLLFGSPTGLKTSIGIYTGYLYVTSTSTSIGINSTSGFLGSIDNISLQEVGWSNSQELYDAIYAQTTGTVEQKTYAAVKAAAMWCYYNNDAAIGAVYGKLYNWFAVKLLQMDIDYYNAANPSTPWGWKVPDIANYNTLSTYLGGIGVVGGKLKKEGLTYWLTPNTNADNSSGFSALGTGYRASNNQALNNRSLIWTIFETASINGGAMDLNYNSNTNATIAVLKTFGCPLRLIRV